MREITIALPEGEMSAVEARPSGDGPHPGIVVIHDIFGLTEDTRRWVRRFAELGFVALAPALYSPGGLSCVVRTLLDSMRGDGPGAARIDAARASLADQADVDAASIAVIGFCMGGGFALLAAADHAFAVAAPFYGTVPRDPARIAGLCPTLAHFGERDLVFLPDARRLQAHLEVLEGPHQVVIQPGVGHSFMNRHDSALSRLGAVGPMRAAWSEEAESEALERVLAWFSEHLPTPPPPRSGGR